ncbi:hypothetical protein BDN70DRAFT_861244 [Pholiota conissans]|uniref:CST complex subunit STN1 n=1 Tax=Pholiota conissans TaxID=109636 RepID=A0A9P5Z0B8_9AGAR|nr:hypothetical protein BDN70DRAFT_861244 [Pholiota conissans]
MSFTLTSTPTKESVIYLSPSKRQRTHAPPTNPNRSKYTKNQLNSWVQRADAVASCSIRDIYNLEASEANRKDPDYYWLGAVPCRNVKVVGMVVGVQEYEKRTLYTVDDGTGVIDCVARHTLVRSPPKPETEAAKYKRVDPVAPLLGPPKPIADVGKLVQVIGTVGHSFERQVIVSKIRLCLSTNDELLHARAVRELHRTSYSSALEFIIPPQQHNPDPQTPIKKRPNSKSMLSSPPSSVTSSPVKDPFQTSPSKSIPKKPTKPAPTKLRHPSRLHTGDLTAITFCIYVKYYMDCISDEDSPSSSTQPDITPRPSSRYQHQIDETPRRIPRLDYGLGYPDNPSFASEPPPSQARPEQRRGFTLSYLRRVSELSLLASRIIDAVSKRRIRAELKEMKANGLPLPRKMPSSKLSPEIKHARMKELFCFAIKQLSKEGSIIIWDGPIRRCPDASVEGVSRLWKANTSASTTAGNSTLFSTTLGASLLAEGDDDDEGALSDPQPGENAYVSLTPEFMANHVEEAIKSVVERKEAKGNPYAGAAKDEVLKELKGDDRWRRLGSWMVDDALKNLKEDERAYTSKDGHWHLTA